MGEGGESERIEINTGCATKVWKLNFKTKTYELIYSLCYNWQSFHLTHKLLKNSNTFQNSYHITNLNLNRKFILGDYWKLKKLMCSLRSKQRKNQIWRLTAKVKEYLEKVLHLPKNMTENICLYGISLRAVEVWCMYIIMFLKKMANSL